MVGVILETRQSPKGTPMGKDITIKELKKEATQEDEFAKFMLMAYKLDIEKPHLSSIILNTGKLVIPSHNQTLLDCDKTIELWEWNQDKDLALRLKRWIKSRHVFAWESICSLQKQRSGNDEKV